MSLGGIGASARGFSDGCSRDGRVGSIAASDGQRDRDPHPGRPTRFPPDALASASPSLAVTSKPPPVPSPAAPCIVAMPRLTVHNRLGPLPTIGTPWAVTRTSSAAVLALS